MAVEECRRAPIGKKIGHVTIEPDDPTQLEVVELYVFASQERAWNGTMIQTKIACPGLKRDFNQSIPNGQGVTLYNAAGIAIGNYQGKATFQWPNGQKLVITFNYRVTH